MSSRATTRVKESSRDMARYVSELPIQTQEIACFSLRLTISLRPQIVLVGIYCMSHRLVLKGPQQQRSTNRAPELKSIIADYLAHSGKQLSDLSSSSIAYLVN